MNNEQKFLKLVSDVFSSKEQELRFETKPFTDDEILNLYAPEHRQYYNCRQCFVTFPYFATASYWDKKENRHRSLWNKVAERIPAEGLTDYCHAKGWSVFVENIIAAVEARRVTGIFGKTISDVVKLPKHFYAESRDKFSVSPLSKNKEWTHFHFSYERYLNVHAFGEVRSSMVSALKRWNVVVSKIDLDRTFHDLHEELKVYGTITLGHGSLLEIIELYVRAVFKTVRDKNYSIEKATIEYLDRVFTDHKNLYRTSLIAWRLSSVGNMIDSIMSGTNVAVAVQGYVRNTDPAAFRIQEERDLTETEMKGLMEVIEKEDLNNSFKFRSAKHKDIDFHWIPEVDVVEEKQDGLIDKLKKSKESQEEKPHVIKREIPVTLEGFIGKILNEARKIWMPLPRTIPMFSDAAIRKKRKKTKSPFRYTDGPNFDVVFTDIRNIQLDIGDHKDPLGFTVLGIAEKMWSRSDFTNLRPEFSVELDRVLPSAHKQHMASGLKSIMLPELYKYGRAIDKYVREQVETRERNIWMSLGVGVCFNVLGSDGVVRKYRIIEDPIA